MKTTTLAVLALTLGAFLLACDEHKYDAIAEASASASSTALAAPPTASTPPPPPLPAFTKKNASDCKPHVVDFTGQPDLEKEVRRKTGKETGTITPADLAQIKSINLSTAKIRQVDPCIFPMLTSVTGIFLGAGDYDDLTPLQKLTTLLDLNVSMSHVKELHAIEGLKRLDRLDISNTQVGDDELKSVGSLVNLTELTLDEDAIKDLTPIANLTKLTLLSIKKTGVQSLAPLSQLKNLKKLYIADTQVTDITPIQPLIATGLKLFQN